jgi:flagellar hook-associated protein 3 FlgL
MRVTESLKFSTVTNQLASLREQYLQTAQQSSSGQRVNSPSDDPIAAAANARVQASISETEAYRKTISFVRGNAELAESSLDSAGQIIQRALELAMSGSNGAVSADQMQALATEAQQLVTQMTAVGNTKGSQGYIFGGTSLDTAPFEPDGTFVGNDADHTVQVDAGQAIAVNASGALAFTVLGGQDVIQNLKGLAGALTNGDTSAIQATLSGLQSAHSQLVQERGRAGLIVDRLTMTDSFLSQQSADMQSTASALTEIDPNAVFSKLTQLETTLQQSVAVSQRLLQTTSLSTGG